MKTSLRPFQTKEKAKLFLMPVKIYYTSKTKPLLDNELFVTVLFSKSQSCMQKTLFRQLHHVQLSMLLTCILNTQWWKTKGF